MPLRGWQRADLNNGEEAMMAERRETPFRSGRDCEPMLAARKASFGDLGDPAASVRRSLISLVFDLLLAALPFLHSGVRPVSPFLPSCGNVSVPST